MSYTKRVSLARHDVGSNLTFNTFEKAMFVSYLRIARWFSPKTLNFSPPPTGWDRLKMSEMVLRDLYENKNKFYDLVAV